MSDQLLLLDIGNTGIKSCLYDLHSPIEQIEVLHITLDQLLIQANPAKKALVCSVRDDIFNRNLEALLVSRTCSVEFIQTASEAFGLTNSYRKISNMGTDRWLGMLGANSIIDGDFIVVDAGTAVTVDAVKRGKHLGGWICAGIKTAKNALLANTSRVFEEGEVANLSFGNDTPECVNNGSLALAKGLLLCAIEQMKAETESFQLVLSGGDGALLNDLISPHIQQECHCVPNIVLCGLAAIANAK